MEMERAIQTEGKMKKFYRKNKWIVNVGIAIVVILAGVAAYLFYNNKVEEEYLSNTEEALNQMLETGALSEDMANRYTDVWHTAIYDGIYNGEVVVSFDKALSKQMKEFENDGTQSDLEDGIQEVENKMNKLQDPPKKYEDMYDRMVSLYGDFKDLSGHAESPSGSYQDYSSSIKKADNSFINKYDEINVKYFN